MGKAVEGKRWSAMKKIYALAKKPGPHTDPGTPGFGLRVSPKGKAVWYVRASRGSGNSRTSINKTIGNLVPEGKEADGILWYNLDQARSAAIAIQQEEQLPEPVRQKLRLRKANTLRSVLPDFLENRRVRGRKTPLSPRSKKDYQKVFDEYLTECANWSLVDHQGAVRPWLNVIRGIAKKSVSQAFYAMNLVSGIYDYLELHQEVERNPMRNVRRLFEKTRPEKRETHVSTLNLPVFIQQAQTIRNKASRTAVMLCLLTGLRNSALLGLKWEWLDLTAGTIQVPEQALGWKSWHGSFALGREACRLLRGWREYSEDRSDWVFPARHGGNKHMVDLRGALAHASKGIEQQVTQEDGTVKMKPYGAHELRRTFGTILNLLYPGDVKLAGALLAHRWAIPESPETEITLRYQSPRQHLQHALDRVAAFVIEVSGAQPMSERTKAALDRVGLDPHNLTLVALDDDENDTEKPKKETSEFPWFLEEALNTD